MGCGSVSRPAGPVYDENFSLPESALICFNIGRQNNPSVHRLQQAFGAATASRRSGRHGAPSGRALTCWGLGAKR